MPQINVTNIFRKNLNLSILIHVKDFIWSPEKCEKTLILDSAVNLAQSNYNVGYYTYTVT